MILVDSSVWIEHIRSDGSVLDDLLDSNSILIHDFVIGEILLGHLKKRKAITNLMSILPRAIIATNNEVIEFIENNKLFGLGIGFVDAHLMVSAILSKAKLWTYDKKLKEIAKNLGVAYLGN